MKRTWLYLVAAGLLAVTVACSGSTRNPGTAQSSARVPAGTASSTSMSVTTATSAELPHGVLASVPLTCCGALINGSPEFPVAAFGSMWVGSHRGVNTFRIDPRTDKVIATIDINDESCTQSVPTPRYLIVSRCNMTSDVKIDPRTDQVAGTVPGHIDAYAFGSAWGVNAALDAIERVDLATNKVTTIRHPDVGPMVVAGHELWMLEIDEAGPGFVDGGILRIDPATNRVLGTIPIPQPGYNANLVDAYGAVWVKGASNATLVRVDLRTRKVTTDKLPGFQAPTDIGDDTPVAGAGSVWLRLNADSIARIDPHNGKIIGRYPSDRKIEGAIPQVAYGSLWIASCDGGFLLRDRIQNP